MKARGVSTPTEVVIVRDAPGQPVLTKARRVPPLWAHRRWQRFRRGYLPLQPLTYNQRIAAEVLAETLVMRQPPAIERSPLLSNFAHPRGATRRRLPWRL